MTDHSPAARDARIDMSAILSAVVVRLPRIILITILALVATYVILMFTPRLYESSADILVEPRGNAYTRALGDTQQTVGTVSTAEGVVSSQIELIKSRDTLLQVIEQTNLRDVPEFSETGFSPIAYVRGLLGGEEEVAIQRDAVVLGNLIDAMTVIQQRDSRVISISVRTQDPELSATLANAIANAHVVRRAQLSLSDTAEASGWLGDEISGLRESVNSAEQAVADFRIENDLFTGNNQTSLLDQQLSTIATQINEAQERKNTARSRAALIRGLVEQGQSLEGVADIQQSAVIQQLSQEKAGLQAERAQLLATRLANHPSVRAIAAQIAELDQQIAQEARRVAAALESESQIEASLEQSLRDELENLKASASDATRETVTLQGLIREAEAQRDLLESYLRRYNDALSRSGSESEFPDVRVISMAAPSVNPAWPPTTMILLAVGIVSVVGQIGLIIFGELLSGRAVVPAHQQRWSSNAPAETESEPAAFADDSPQHAPAPLAEAEDTDTAVDEIEAGDLMPAAAAATPLAFETSSHDDAVEDDGEMPATVAPMSGPRPSGDHERLASDIAIGRCRIVMLAAETNHLDSLNLADVLVRETLNRGISVALVDAGSAKATEMPGIADLSAGRASFGDVVQKSGDAQFAEVAWGTSATFERRSKRPATLVQALSDIYEVVIVLTGRAGMRSTLPAFAGIGDRLVLVAGENSNPEALEDRVAELEEAGLGRAEVIAPPQSVAA
ncbi:GumC family protein [Devosia pacifica]|nr:GumC family protein [Devosia pacifica]